MVEGKEVFEEMVLVGFGEFPGGRESVVSGEVGESGVWGWWWNS